MLCKSYSRHGGPTNIFFSNKGTSDMQPKRRVPLFIGSKNRLYNPFCQSTQPPFPNGKIAQSPHKNAVMKPNCMEMGPWKVYVWLGTTKYFDVLICALSIRWQIGTRGEHSWMDQMILLVTLYFCYKGQTCVWIFTLLKKERKKNAI